MEFIDHLNQKMRLRDLYGPHKPTDSRVMPKLKLQEDLFMSIQSSYDHYCEPRITLVDLNRYESFEVAFTRTDGSFVPLSVCAADLSEYDALPMDEPGLYPFLKKEDVERIFQALRRDRVQEAI